MTKFGKRLIKRSWSKAMTPRTITLLFVFSYFTLLAFCGGTARPILNDKENAPIAVWDLEDVSPLGEARPDLGELLSSQIIETFKNQGKYTVVERERFLLALEELGLGTTSLVDDNTRLKLGRIVGAKLMVFGGYQVIAGAMRLDLRLVEVETAKIVKATKQISPGTNLSAWLKAAEKAAKDLL